MSEDKGKISRRDFSRGAAMGVLGGTALGMGLFSYSPWGKEYLPKAGRKLADSGTCKSVKVTNISETSWFENAGRMGNIKGAGGLLVNQYSYNWPPFGDGTGLGKGTYENGVAKIRQLLPNNIEEARAITTYIPEGFYPEGLQYLKDAGHKGHLIKVKPGLNPLIPGLATFVFAVPIICRVYGEQSIYANVKDHGLVSITGCCHQGIIQFAETAFKEVKYENDQLYGIYGGLRISPFEDWDPKYNDLLISLGKYGFQKIGCNHCTGLLCAKKFVEGGYPVIKGSARFRTKETNYPGNGDKIGFGIEVEEAV
jgi:hypothetical protein